VRLGTMRAQGGASEGRVSSADWYDVMRARRVLRCDSSASVFRVLGCISREYGGSFSSFPSLPFPSLPFLHSSLLPPSLPSLLLPSLPHSFLSSLPPSSPFSALLPTPYELTALNSLVPVIAVGFDDLRQRVGMQGRRRERTRSG
jgi:hypothetical protein